MAAKLTPEQEALIKSERPQNLEDGQTMVGYENEGFDGGPQTAVPVGEESLEDMRSKAEAALGPRPTPGRLTGPPDALDDTPDDDEEDRLDELTAEDAAEAFPPPIELQEVRAAAMNTSLIPPRDDEDEDPQTSYLPPDVPEGHLGAPPEAAFANATWLVAGAQFKALVDEVFAYPEFAGLREFDYEVIWHRKGTPTHPWADLDGERAAKIANVTVTDRLASWYSLDIERPLPAFFVGLFYTHFADLANDGFYFHNEQIKMQIHMALSALDGESGILKKRPPELVVQSVSTIERWGIQSSGARRAQGAFAMWPQAGQ